MTRFPPKYGSWELAMGALDLTQNMIFLVFSWNSGPSKQTYVGLFLIGVDLPSFS
jgi:hypothetical protein